MLRFIKLATNLVYYIVLQLETNFMDTLQRSLDRELALPCVSLLKHLYYLFALFYVLPY